MCSSDLEHNSDDSSVVPLLPLYPMQCVPRGGRPKGSKNKSKKIPKKYRRIKGHKERQRRISSKQGSDDEEDDEEQGGVDELEEEDGSDDEDNDVGILDSLIVSVLKRKTQCTHCGKPGHNCQTCPRPDTKRLLRQLKLLPPIDESKLNQEVNSFVIASSDWLARDSGLYSVASWQQLGTLMSRFFDDCPGPSCMILPGASQGIIKKRVHFDAELKMFNEQAPWPRGTILEAEMMDPKFVKYYGTIHPVRVVKAILETNEYECSFLAFGDGTDVWEAKYLHEPQVGQPNVSWEIGDNVHCLLRHREVAGVGGVDGDVSETGVWVKGVIASKILQGGKHYLVRHSAWTGKEDARVTTKAHVNDIRRGYD